ncbi:MAG TPA: AAA-like domain-containing protein [Halomicronema sp.]
MSFEFPSGPIPLGSLFYVERQPLENRAYEEITKPGAVVRIKAPRQMGKTSLLMRLLDRATKADYRTVYIDFQQADEEVFLSGEKFFRWFCANVSRQLNLLPKLDDYWDEDIGSKISTTLYFQGYLLDSDERPLVLAFNEVNLIFEYPKIAADFLALLRSWHEEAKQEKALEKLRLVVVHSTEVYLTLNINQSPFNVGLPLSLPQFNLHQIEDLAARHGMNWQNELEAKKLIEMVGGHPYLVRLALYYLATDSTLSLDQLLTESPTFSGIYKDHLRSQFLALQRSPELANAFKQVLDAKGKTKLNHIFAYKLESMGLVKIDGNECVISCQLYQKYFANQQFEELENLQQKILLLQAENLELQNLSKIDDLTKLPNRRSFEDELDVKWRTLAATKSPLALIFLDVDYLKLYNRSYGNKAGDECLQKIAQEISKSRNFEQINSEKLVDIFRYGDDQFAIILANINECKAKIIAEKIRNNIQKLSIYHSANIGGLPANVITASLGVTYTIPDLNVSPYLLIKTAEKALYQAKKLGRNCSILVKLTEGGEDSLFRS